MTPVVSACIKCVPPIPKSGNMATDNTTIPPPPIQWVNARHKSIDEGRLSISVNIDAPTVVKPETDSNKASTIFGIEPDK